MSIRRFCYCVWVLSTAFLQGTLAFAAGPAASPTVEQALKLTPIQKGVDFDQPTPQEAAKCTIKAEKTGGQTGWVVRDASGTILREFVDTNGDNTVDRWSYYNDGVEVYRDIDSDYNGKADSYRWLNTAGTRWGVDKNEDGVIDSWKVISAEEVASEVVEAIRAKDTARFNRLLLSASEAKALGLGPDKAKTVGDKLAKAPADFGELAKTQKVVAPKTNWVQFGASRPGVVPAGTDGATTDLVVYENVVAMVETEGKPGQVIVGTIIKVGDTWRLCDAPHLPTEGSVELPASGIFYAVQRKEIALPAGAPSEGLQKLMAELEKLDGQLTKAPNAAEKTKLNDRRADLLEQMVTDAGEKEKSQWIRQFADTIGAAVQTGEYPTGIERLRKFTEQVEKDSEDKETVSYVKFRTIMTDYQLNVQSPGADFVKIQANWMDGLEKFVTDYPKGADAAEALLQLGNAQEFSGQEDKAKKWYDQLQTTFPGTMQSKRAAGAMTRLNSVGRPITLQGRSATGQNFSLPQLRGKTVLIQYWATWCEPAKADMAQLKELRVKYAKEGFEVVGVSLDSDAKTLNDFLQRNKLPWAQLFEPGGLDSRYALELGIHTVPTMLLLDAKGNVVNRNVHVSELDAELRRLFK